MSAWLHVHQKEAQVPPFMPLRTSLLQRKCACGGSAGLSGMCAECQRKQLFAESLQPKLRINEPGDIYEQEADRVADQVMRMSEPSLQRQATAEEEEEEEELLQTKRQSQRQVEGGTETPSETPAIVHEVLRSPGQPLDASTRAFMEPRFGHDFSQVRVHTNAKAVESARAVNALAYTVEKDVVFGAGQYEPATSEGRRLLAHELTHVVQQRQTPAHLIQREPQDEVQHEAPGSEESMAPRKFVMRRDIVFIMDFAEAAKLASADAAVFEVQTPEEMAMVLKTINFPIGTIYVFAHSSQTADIKFPGSGWITATSLANTLKDSINLTIRPATIDFRGCSVGMNPAGMEEIRQAVGARDIIGSSCYMVFERLPFTVDHVHIKDPKQLEDPKVKVTFDRHFPTHWEKFSSKACVLDTSQDAYFKAGGYLVSMFANKEFTEIYSEKDSVCYKDLPVSTLSPVKALTDPPSATGPCTLVRVDRDADLKAEEE